MDNCLNRESAAEKLLRYARIDTPSDENNDTQTPSTKCQLDLARQLKKELESLGLKARLTDNGYLYSRIPANGQSRYKVGFIAHLDVVQKPKGYGVKPMVHKNYTGGDICLSTGKISPKDFPELDKFRGGDIITSDGTTVLGADDKAGVAEIMALAEYLLSNPQIKHGDVGIAFTPDEEIGHGAKLFDVAGFGCDFAYTVDGETLGEISYETFNGASFCYEISGVNIHPGQAKGKMINALCVANDILREFPASERPETTEGREGYYFFSEIAGDVEKCALHGIVRDHDGGLFERRKQKVLEVGKKYSDMYGGRVKVSVRDQYFNCAQVIAPHMHIVERAVSAMQNNGVQPIIEPIRGGTDGSSLSFMGLPCPNICTGGQNAHGLNEWICAQAMDKVVNILCDIVKSCVK